VAADVGNHDLAQVWGLVKLILDNQVPIKITPDTDIIIIARRALGDIKKKDSGVDLSYDGPRKEKPTKSTQGAHLRWGEHPLGGSWLIPAL
jgi:hypothetical protein